MAMSAPLPLSVVIVACNEEHNLPRCLRGLRDWTTEVIVAINNCTDDSARVAADFGAAVHHLPWRGYRDTKNDALSLATQPWVLFLDADEMVSPELRDALAAFLARPDAETHAAARFPRKVWFMDRWITHGDWYPDYGTRLIRSGRARWGGDEIVHEKMIADGPVATLRGDLYHFSFPTLLTQVSKIPQFARLFLRQQEKRPDRSFSAVSAVTRSLWRFFRGYVLRRGFLDGFPGLFIAVGNAYGTWVKYSLVYEDQHAKTPPV
jgi:glycosyltransferase involved in cell wall biosynthesis